MYQNTPKIRPLQIEFWRQWEGSRWLTGKFERRRSRGSSSDCRWINPCFWLMFPCSTTCWSSCPHSKCFSSWMERTRAWNLAFLLCGRWTESLVSPSTTSSCCSLNSVFNWAAASPARTWPGLAHSLASTSLLLKMAAKVHLIEVHLLPLLKIA